jgi:hypothetical protein
MGLGIALVAYWILRSCLPSFGGGLPSDLRAELQQRYTVCITDTPIWPGEPRQPECSQVTLDVVGEGSLPADAVAAGVDRAICFQMTITNPSWTTQGTTRHEIVHHGHLVSKVAMHKGGIWVVEPDQDQMDEARWNQFACPGPFRSEAFNP